jgi:hypothetical protein
MPHSGYRDDLLPLLKRHLFEGHDGIVACAVDQDIYSACLGTDRIRKATRVILVGNISLDRNEPVLGVSFLHQALEGILAVVAREDSVSVSKETIHYL